MTTETCLMVLVLVVIVASFIYDLHAYLTARRAQKPRHAKRRARGGP